MGMLLLNRSLSRSLLEAGSLAFTTQPSAVNAGATMSSVVVTVRQRDGNTATPFTGTIAVALTTPGGATLGGTVAVAASAGVAAFSALAPTGDGAELTLTATSPGLTSAVSSAFDVFDQPLAVLPDVWTAVEFHTESGSLADLPDPITTS